MHAQEAILSLVPHIMAIKDKVLCPVIKYKICSTV